MKKIWFDEAGLTNMDVYKSIMTGLNEAVEYEKGTVKARKAKCTVNPVPDFNAQEIKHTPIQRSFSCLNEQLTAEEIRGKLKHVLNTFNL